MIKSISLLTRKAGLSHEEFVKHWLEVHAPLADLDLEATRQQNDDRGITFQLPPPAQAN